MKQNVLLLDDVDDLGRSGDVVSVKSGYARNFLIPKKLGVVAQKHTLRMQEKLKEERAKKAVVDKKESSELAKRLEGLTLETKVKVDPEGRMYGSVNARDIVHLFEEKEFPVVEKNVQLKKPIKEIGEHTISIKLKEGVEVTVILHVESDTPLKKSTKKPEAEEVEAAPEEAKTEEVKSDEEEKA